MMLAPNTPKVPVLPSEFATLKFTKGTIRRSGSLTSPNSQPTPMTLHAPLSSGRISKRRFSSSGNRKKSFGPASVKSFEDVTTPMVKESPLFYDVDEPSIDEPHKPLECNNYSIFKSLFTPIRPDGRFKNNWMQLVSLAYFYVLAVVPYRIAFLDGLDKTQSMILTIIFGIDTTINLITLRVNDDGFEIPFLPSLVRNFFSIPFLVDVASTVPWSLYFQNNCCDTDRWNSNGFDLIRLARLFRLSKIMKTPFYRQMARTMRETLGLGNNFMALFTFFCIIVVFLHFNGCFIILMGRDNAFRDKAWLKMQPQNMMPPEKYSQGMWMALANMIPVTFKAWRPDTLNAQWSELFFCLFGAIASASITGTISALSLGEQSPAGKFIQRLDQLKEWLHARKADETYLESRVMKGF
ncbi:hypothetical protein BCR33DRAFT_373107 [Rhizoclosmatium globosum]|uniref:Ion transport domain-containing protein n=1 Tax=Rhizoclosmatium globosum TaxID=329046 RepID=A0A1Y2BZN0_9FUNG|nr:hypothetical protein BCR33DRAFT_373107 [Rhizoclosmatium globosum]|eukprot:ORY40228.1 hypothetical protein BCR33DRAFT_373107 [Rhizoclosmatium globosum]